ncbi:hypothetical protein MTYM_01444 [Methylococcales bacterium]|nr:hypothetical protein MTYM_01444 [Methylococcales bacterium]
MTIKPWGSRDRYYSEPEQWNPKKKPKTKDWDDEELFPPQPDAETVRKHWESLLKAIDPNAEERVTRTFRTWNLIVRDQLRNETGFRLTHGEQQVNVPVRIVPGIPAPLMTPLWDAREEGVLLLHRNLIEKATQGVGFVRMEFSLVTNFLHKKRAIPHLEPEFLLDIENVHGFLKTLDDELKKIDLLSKILKIEEDILGAYFFKKRQVQIYWLAIGIVALMLDVEIEALTVVVLAHELAHAYTHLGRDIDGRQWETETFAQTDIHIVEGLAQYYTQSVCKKLAARFPSALESFKTLLKQQSAPYQCFQDWIEDRKADPGEFVRQCMIQTRTKPFTNYDAFPGKPQQEASVTGKQAK